MPVDYKRINGPENTFPYQLYETAPKEKPALLSNNLRSDGRNLADHRKIFLKTGVVSQAKGSAYIEVEKTKVIVSVFDPREIPNKTEYCLNGELYCEFKYAPFSCRIRRQHQQDAEEKKCSVILQRALESAVCRHQFPNFQVDVYALVLENDGSALSAAITCAGVALAHAGVPMYDLVTAVTLGIREGNFLLDPNAVEEDVCSLESTGSGVKMEVEGVEEETEEEDYGIVVIATLPTHEQVSQFYQAGNLSLSNLTKSINMLIEANKKLVPLVEKCLVKYVKKAVARNVEQ